MHGNKQLGLQSMQNHEMTLWYDNWVKKNFGGDPLHPDHSITCTAVAVLHLPTLPPFPGHVSLIHAVQTMGARGPCFAAASCRFVLAGLCSC